MTQREQTWCLDGGRCVACGKQHRKGASAWDYQAHHVLKVQTLRWLGARPARIKDATYTVITCRLPCHANHESRHAVIPFEALPVRVVRAIDALGPAAQDQLRIYHPLTVAGRHPA